MMDPVTIIVAVLVLVLLIYVIQAFLPMDARMKNLLIIVVIILIVLYLVGRL